MSAGRKQQGFTLLGMMIVIAIMGAGLAAYGELASHAAQREKEAELLFRGNQYRQAIESYYEKERRYPRALADLLEDRRFPMPVRHLRKLYADPLTGAADWEIVQAPDGGIMGVHSKSEGAPIKSGNFTQRDAAFSDAASYSQWQFMHKPPASPIEPRPVR